MSDAATCDACLRFDADSWCEDCSLLLCPDCRMGAAHSGHRLGAIGNDEGGTDVPVDDDTDVHSMKTAADNGVCSGTQLPRSIREQVAQEDIVHYMGNQSDDPRSVCAALFYPPPHSHPTVGSMLPRRDSSAADERPLAHRRVLGPDETIAFRQHQFLVLPAAISRAVALAANQCLVHAYDNLRVAASHPSRVDSNRLSTPSTLRHRYASLDEASPWAFHHPAFDRVKAFFAQLGSELNAVVRLVDQGSVADRELQVSSVTGSGNEREERGRDALPCDGYGGLTLIGKGTASRRVTCVVFLADAVAGGGELVLSADASASRPALCERIDAAAGRVVIFLSGALHHETLVAHTPQCRVTGWFK